MSSARSRHSRLRFLVAVQPRYDSLLYFRLRCSRSLSFSLQNISKMSESGSRSWGTLIVKGLVYISGSSKVIRFAIGSARRRGGQVRFAVARERRSGRRIVHPLRVHGRGEESE